MRSAARGTGVGDGVRVVVVAVEEDDPLEADRRERRAQVLDQRHERRDADVDDAREPDMRIRQGVVDGRRRRAPRSARRRGAPTSVGTIASVSSGPCGPCCSVEPVGMMIVWVRWRAARTSGSVISPRNTVAASSDGPPRAGQAMVVVSRRSPRSRRSRYRRLAGGARIRAAWPAGPASRSR